jgi:hypothetical protein
VGGGRVVEDKREKISQKSDEKNRAGEERKFDGFVVLDVGTYAPPP